MSHATASTSRAAHRDADRRIVIGSLFKPVVDPSGASAEELTKVEKILRRPAGSILVYDAPSMSRITTRGGNKLYAQDAAQTLEGVSVPVGILINNPARRMDEQGRSMDPEAAMGAPLESARDARQFRIHFEPLLPQTDPDFLRIVHNNRSAGDIVNHSQHPDLRAMPVLGAALVVEKNPDQSWSIEALRKELKVSNALYRDGKILDARVPESLITYAHDPDRTAHIHRAMLVEPIRGLTLKDHIGGLKVTRSIAVGFNDGVRDINKKITEHTRFGIASMVAYANILKRAGVYQADFKPTNFMMSPSDSKTSVPKYQLVAIDQDEVVRADGPVSQACTIGFTAPWVASQLHRLMVDGGSPMRDGAVSDAEFADKTMASSIASSAFALMTGKDPLSGVSKRDQINALRMNIGSDPDARMWRLKEIMNSGLNQTQKKVLDRAWTDDLQKAPTIDEVSKAFLGKPWA